MCRLYKSKNGDYVRLCYYHGNRRGERIRFVDLPMDIGDKFLAGQIVHVPKSGTSRRPVKGRADKSSLRRCAKCGSPLNRANYEIGVCYLCQEGR
jgi:hypothetical protein